MRVAWISFFPVEWLPDAPQELRDIPRLHPAPWQRTLVEELKTVPGLELHIFSVRKHFPRTFSFQRDGITFHCIKVPGGMRTLSLFWWETLQLRRGLRKVQPDLVHAWGAERGAAIVASRLAYPYLVTMQGLLEWIAQFVKFRGAERMELQLERPGLRRARFVTAESSFAVKWLRDHYPHLEVHQVEHAPALLFQKVDRRPMTKPVQFLYVGTITRLKGSDLLFRALDQLRPELDFKVSVIGFGEPDYLAQLKGTTAPALWERITLQHGLTQAEVAQEMGLATMLLFPTRVDNSPNSVKEAVVSGLPVVASSVGGITDYVLPGRNGFTLSAGNLDEFVKAIRAAVAHPLLGAGKVEPETLTKMRDYLSPRLMREKFLRIYSNIASTAGPDIAW